MTSPSADTIFALATPPGRSAIAVIRISGPLASSVPAIFSASCPTAGHFSVARLFDKGQVLDQVILLFMKGPRSSTGEDLCEIHCHGSQAVITSLLAKLGAVKGLRMAEAGEFSRRSFMNGKMDLTAVEGLSDLIESQTSAQLHQAWAQIDGALRAPVMLWRGELVTLAAELEALIDFSDEDLPSRVIGELHGKTKKLIDALSASLNDGGVGELVRDGVKIVLIGPVNAGKSTILNALAGRAASIVSEEAGTTRDVIQVNLDLAGVPARLLDTAGIRENIGVVESEGVRRAVAAAETADLALIIVDGSTDDSLQQLKYILPYSKGERLVVVNKEDRGSTMGCNDLLAMGVHEHMQISAKNPSDIERLLAELARRLVPHNRPDASVLITRARHRDAIETAEKALSRALEYDFNETPELAAEEFRLATTALGRITGEIDVEELLGQIFSAFCIGK